MALYTQALVWSPSSETLLSNRSAAYAAAGQFKSALEDAVKCGLEKGSHVFSFFWMLDHAVHVTWCILCHVHPFRNHQPEQLSWLSQVHNTGAYVIHIQIHYIYVLTPSCLRMK